MPAVNREPHKKGDFLVDYEEKVFEDVKAEPWPAPIRWPRCEVSASSVA